MITVTRTNNPFATIIAHAENERERRQLFATIRMTTERSLKDSAIAKGGRHFWRDLADSVTGESDADSAIVGATHPAAAIRQYGGTISAPGKGPLSTGAKYLAIPISDKARGKSPREFQDLFFVMAKGGGKYLFSAINNGEIFYILKKSVEHPADPWLPSDNKIAEELRAAAHAWLDSRSRTSASR
ncbi:MAG: hypothetical protein PHP98_10560 [Kiritimatiellae bacterium]|nr:hypothetical protein [Kiritimatiellia bacterium]